MNDNRLSELFEIARRTQRYGSLESHLPKESLHTVRVSSVLVRRPAPLTFEQLHTPFDL
jgi:hypothetical protein